MARFLKRNSILIAFLGVYAAVVVLVLYQLDKQNFQARKREMILLDPKRYFELSGGEMNALRELAQKAMFLREKDGATSLSEYLRDLQAGNPALALEAGAIQWLRGISQRTAGLSASEADAALSDAIGRIVEGDNNIHRIAIQGPSPRALSARAAIALDRSNERKLRSYNNFSNSLFLRDFSGQSMQYLSDTEDVDLGRIFVYYTTPQGAPAFEELTIQYRWYATFIVAVLTMLAALVARTLLLPLRQVTGALESSGASGMAFVQRPRSRLETLYNRMALGAVAARLSGRLRDEIAQRPQLSAWELVQQIVEAFGEQAGLPLVAALEIATEGPGRMRSTGAAVLAGEDRFIASRAEATRRLAETLGGGEGFDGALRPAADAPALDAATRLLPDPNRPGIRYLFAVATMRGGEDSGHASRQGMLASLVDLADSGLQTLALRNQLLVQERGRANISLSRNLGHDLTNIIATSKLDLMALDKLLHDGRGPQDETRRGLLLESLASLMRSVRFMQETVNLYRAYAFLQHPVLETQDGNRLIEETLELFAMSISSKIRIVRELAADAPRCMVDPRLVKLALFNLFTNALEAIRRQEDEEVASGWIKVATSRSATGGLAIAVEDSGPGIVKPHGERAAPDEIEKIFELGYSGRRTGQNHKEGLGLNWVRTIVHDLHGGSIRAENVAGGGARFIIIFPPLEQAARSIENPVKA